LGDARKLVGPSVILVHRLLKNSIVERTGVRGYGYLTDGALAAHSLEGGVSGTQHEEHYDIGTCRGIVVDLTARWRAEESRRMIFVTTEEAIASFEVDTTASPALAWRCLTTPHALAGWMADRVEERGSGPRGAGTVLHCVHGKQHFSSEIVDWKPYRFFTWRITMRGTPSMLSTVELLSGPHGGTRISYRVVPAGRVLSRLAGRLMAPILRSSMRQTGERLSRTLTEMEQEHAFALAGEGGGMVSEDPEKNIREGATMSQPFIHIGTFRIKEGKFEEVTRSYREVVETVEEHEPRMIAFHGFVNEDGTEMTVIQLHPDTASMDFHMQVLTDKLGEYVARALGPDLIELRRSEYYGTPSESALEMDRQIPGLAVDFKPIHVAGFTRTTSG
jgi:uncharacterized protein YndB with AHSA1/START domain/quinol monooxygenase YgiN